MEWKCTGLILAGVPTIGVTNSVMKPGSLKREGHLVDRGRSQYATMIKITIIIITIIIIITRIILIVIIIVIIVIMIIITINFSKVSSNAGRSSG